MARSWPIILDRDEGAWQGVDSRTAGTCTSRGAGCGFEAGRDPSFLTPQVLGEEHTQWRGYRSRRGGGLGQHMFAGRGREWKEQLSLVLGASVSLRKDACWMHRWLSLFLQMSLYSFESGVWDDLWIFRGWLSILPYSDSFLELSFLLLLVSLFQLHIFFRKQAKKIKRHLNLVPFGGFCG